MNDNSMAIDYSNMNINTYQQDLYEIQLKLDNEQLISADITYDDLADLHNWMTRKRKGINALKFKTNYHPIAMQVNKSGQSSTTYDKQTRLRPT
eukprot:TRINITY_DN2178_c0_g1_i1.p1 TRINITY_DN2178_c0_g1~~TRINITY_DN2178_c0_g1_i1.p1  ORF type:complete len:107 (-),score=13.09 TRINITY_DN2178_c0_g1_i1:218-499(-)